jgi:hypothetical protein
VLTCPKGLVIETGSLGSHDDQLDAVAGAFASLTLGPSPGRLIPVSGYRAMQAVFRELPGQGALSDTSKQRLQISKLLGPNSAIHSRSMSRRI